MEESIRHIMQDAKDKPRISIVVPLYNCGKGHSIQTLVEAVLRQTEKSWELILCNDGSEDNTFDLCRAASTQDTRIIAIDNPHRGVSATRNSGIEHSTGEWIAFVDADDHITDCFLESLLKAATNFGTADMACCSYMVLSNNRSQASFYSDRRYKGKEAIRYLFESTDFLYRCSPWARLFRADIIRENDIRFNEKISHSEDRLFLYDFLQYTNGIATSSTIGYIYESFSSGTLKHKVHPFDMLLLRQTEMTEKALKVLTRFSISKTGSYHFLNNLLNILFDGAQSVSCQTTNEKEAISRLQHLVETTNELKDLLISDSRIQKRINEDELLSRLLSGDLRGFNSVVRRQRKIVRIKQQILKLIHKKTHPAVFGDYVKYLNY